MLSQAERREAMEDELADVLFFLLRFSSRAKVDLSQAFRRKLDKNALKYPVEIARGSNLKYSERDQK
jgi:NTP pyrophosphatase (non-canonical NTP hydrolase)